MTTPSEAGGDISSECATGMARVDTRPLDNIITTDEESTFLVTRSKLINSSVLGVDKNARPLLIRVRQLTPTNGPPPHPPTLGV